MKGLTLNQKEQARLETLNHVLEGSLKVREAAVIVGVSERHTWRMLAAYREEGATALAHGNRGRQPVNAVAEAVRQQVVELARTRYTGFNHTHFTELLAEREGLVLSRSTVRNILTRAGMQSPRRRRPPQHRVRRERFPQEGMLLQIDGSPHDWLEERGPRLMLLLAVDDATSKVPAALFREQEDAQGYFQLLKRVIDRKGIPMALYTDRHTVFWNVKASRKHRGEEARNQRRLTQFGRALQELGVGQVFARSPQAKGRVERAGGTFQDRLVSELRMAGARTMEEANGVLDKFLPRYNERFGIRAAQAGNAYRPVPPELKLETILCFRSPRKVARDNTVQFSWQTLQLLPPPDHTSYAGARVDVQQRMDGTLCVVHQGRTIPTREAPPRRSALQDPRMWKGSDDEERFVKRLARYVPDADAEVATPEPMRRRQPTPRMRAYWEAVQEAKSRGLSLHAIARDLGIARNTVKKYARATQPPAFGDGKKQDGQRNRQLTESLVSSP